MKNSKKLILLGVLGLFPISAHARRNPLENPEIIPWMIVVVVAGAAICFISANVSKLSRKQPFYIALFYMFSGLVLIILVLYICIQLLIYIAERFAM